ncbi:MAG: protein of the alpha/beta hydrolase superfamily [Rickettsiaceae bacterium]|jgi:pimeloyl-ACP methyl ester carboxylesterase|nr:protein of the alpha/beta hydrolase superfamily [Rickettsiaceae bacterium]
MQKASILKLSNNNYIAYHKTEGKKNKPTVIFLGGFMSDMSGNKATALENFCKKETWGFIRFDYIGHGESSGKFTDGTISIWKDNALKVIDNLSEGNIILIGSSMGGWLMLLAALERPERVVGLIGVASAPDFTENLIWEIMSDTQKEELNEKGICDLKSEYSEAPYPITMQLIEDGRKNLLLNGKININCPVRLIHGLLDHDVPASCSIKLGELLTTDNMCVNLIQNGDHRMSEPPHLELLCNTLSEMMENATN